MSKSTEGVSNEPLFLIVMVIVMALDQLRCVRGRRGASTGMPSCSARHTLLRRALQAGNFVGKPYASQHGLRLIGCMHREHSHPHDATLIALSLPA